jgi:hypothetical protein
MPSAWLALDLGSGELAALALALEHRNSLKGRGVCRSRGRRCDRLKRAGDRQFKEGRREGDRGRGNEWVIDLKI